MNSELATAQLRSRTPAARAAGSSFYAAMRILPRGQRQALFEIYSFCRAVDDIADRDGPRAERQAELERWRRRIDALYSGDRPDSPDDLALAADRFALDRNDLIAIIDGMEMDVMSEIRAPSLTTLDLYCDRVASAVGRLCVKVFGLAAPEGKQLAHHLGRALQLTNILRDLDEDAAFGRLYLPKEFLRKAGINATNPAEVLAHKNIGQVCEAVVELARSHFEQADAIMSSCPRRVVRAPRMMAEAYKRKLDRLTRRGWSSPRHKLRSSRLNLLWIYIRHAIFG